MNRHLITGAFLLPALLLSCNDDGKNLGPSVPDPVPTSSRVAPINDHKIRLAQPSGATLADAQAELKRLDEPVTAFVGGNSAHDPTKLGQRVVCVDGDEFANPPARSDKFNNNHGCEHNSLAGGASITLPLQNFTRGKKVKDIRRLEFFYAGGPQNGGAPRFSLFTDFCKVPTPNDVSTTTTPNCRTDGHWDETLFIDVNGCNDGDVYVGAVRLRSDPNSQTDATCLIFEAFGADGIAGDPDGAGPLVADEHVHANWADYVAAHPNDRMAVDFFPFAPASEKADNFIITDVPVHYLIYRVRMQ